MILLTGGTGTVGNAIALELIRSQRKFVVTTRNTEHSKSIESSNQIIECGDVFDSSFLKKIFEKYRFETIIHCAWSGVTRESRNYSDQINNFTAFKVLLELSGTYKIKTFVGIGSQAEYGIYNIRITEEFTARPNNLYGLYKLSSGLLGKLLAERYGFRFAWLRLFAAYGPNDNKQFFIPYAIDSFLENRAPHLSSCEQCWDYLFLPDISLIIKKIIDAPQHFNDIYNLSSGTAIKLMNIVLIIKDILKSEINPNFGSIAKNNDLFFLEGANEKLARAFNITNLTDINTGLSLTVDSHKTRMALQVH